MNDTNKNKVDVNYYTVAVESEDENEYHELINGSKAVIVEAEIGKPAWFCYLTDDITIPWHRVRTSDVTDIRETTSICLDSYPPQQVRTIEICTANSKYIFRG